MDVALWVWGALLAGILAMLAVDLFMHRDAHVIGVKEAAIWSGIWVAVAVAVGGLIWWAYGAEFGLQYFAGYVTEKALSVDNLFVFTVIMASFAVPRMYQQKLLLIGIVMALVMRAGFIALGAAAINAFSWVFYLFGIFLILTALKLAREGAVLFLMSCDRASLARMLECNPIPYPSTILSRALFERSGGFGLTYEIVNDYEFWLRVMARRPQVDLLDRVLANMREGGQSSSQASVANRARHQFELFRVQRAHTSLPRACRSQVARLVDFVRTRAAGTVR
jgi:hypothetical protein